MARSSRGRRRCARSAAALFFLQRLEIVGALRHIEPADQAFHWAARVRVELRMRSRQRCQASGLDGASPFGHRDRIPRACYAVSISTASAPSFIASAASRRSHAGVDHERTRELADDAQVVDLNAEARPIGAPSGMIAAAPASPSLRQAT